MTKPKKNVMRCNYCGGLLRRGSLAYHLGCMNVVYKIINHEAHDTAQ